MKADLQFFCSEWTRQGKKFGLTRSIEYTNCLFNEGELVLIISQSKKNPFSGADCETLRVFHTISQNKSEFDSNEDIARLKFLFHGLNEDFVNHYDNMLAESLSAAS